MSHTHPSGRPTSLQRRRGVGGDSVGSPPQNLLSASLPFARTGSKGHCQRLREIRLALRNDLRYPPSSHNNILASEFAWELRQYGHIFMYRFCPLIHIRAYPIDQYPCRTRQAASIMLIIMNNLDPAVAQVTTTLTYCTWHTTVHFSFLI
ncbi:urocanate hydratase [Salmo salar]|uniref:Urocanate hydratase n=1 Tax=Salmo salar TaxID=8030 RepID=A0ABM3CND1_SALSA|nr:urocanate hydratase [Salmo salar]